MAKEPRNYSGSKWRRKDRFDHIITEDSARAGYNFLKPRAYASLTGLLGCAGIIAVLLAISIMFNWLALGLNAMGIMVTGDQLFEVFTRALTWPVYALFIFAPVWMVQGIVRFLLPPERRFPAIPVWMIYIGSVAVIVALDVTGNFPNLGQFP